MCLWRVHVCQKQEKKERRKSQVASAEGEGAEGEGAEGENQHEADPDEEAPQQDSSESEEDKSDEEQDGEKGEDEEDPAEREARQREAAGCLTAEEEERKLALERDGFPMWTRKHFQQYIQACTQFGKENLAEIAQAVEGQTPAAVKK